MTQRTTWTPSQLADFCRRTGQQNPLENTPSAVSTLGNCQTACGGDISHKKVHKQREMNPTESGFFAIQQAKIRKGELSDCIFEALSFGIGGGVRYKVDFMLRYPGDRLEFAEIKGRKIWPQDLVRFKVAADRWGWLGEFQLWQGIKGKYERIR
jgi:hypothetical protein